PSFLQSEFQTLRTLRHPALVGALDWVVEDDFTVLVEEYIEGEQAAPWARWQSQRDLLMAFSKIAHGLMHLHARGFVHLDVNPNNLLVDSAKVQLRLVDLGLARPLGQAGASGTPGFIAPEVLHGEPADARADVWSLAATMIFLLEGESSDALSLRSWLGSIQPEPLRALLDSALSELPSKRPDMRAFWRGILSEAGVRDVAHAPMALTPMVGRSKEKQLFKEFLQESTTTLLLHGTGGSGRSELLRAWGDLARVSGYRVIELNASSSGCHQFLWDALSQHEGEAKVPLHISHQSPVDAARALVLRAEKSALETPLLLSFDDADPELLSSAIMKEALRLWFSRGQKSRTKIIAVSHCGDFGAQCMKLGALSSEDHAQWIDLAWGGEPPPGMRRALFDLSGGLAGPTWRALLRLSEGKDLRRAGEETLLEEGLLAGQLWHLLRHFDRDLSTAQLSVISKEYNQNTSDFLEDWLFRGQLVRSSVAGNIFYFIPTRLKLSITQLPPDEAHRFSEALLKAGLVSEAALFVARSGDMQRAFDLVDGQSHELQIFAVLSELIALEEWPAKLQDDYFKLAASEGQSDFFERVLKAMAGESGPVVQNLRRSWASASILQGQYQKALGLLPESHAIEDAMQRARALYFLGQIAEARQEAVTYLDAAQGAERGRLLEVRGNCEMAEGESHSAFESLSEAVALFGEAKEILLFSRASHSLAIVCQRLGDYKSAQEHYEISLRDAPPLAA
ncbi:protein kinase, partial [Myxococcota bacterium]|nr:protein kinase [Myxococcota bacterium]